MTILLSVSFLRAPIITSRNLALALHGQEMQSGGGDSAVNTLTRNVVTFKARGRLFNSDQALSASNIETE